MSDESKTGETPQPAAVTDASKVQSEPVAVQAASTTPPELPKGETPDDYKAVIARLEKELKERNKEEAGRRKKLEELEKAEAERADAQKTELQKAQDRAAKAENEAKSIKLSLLRREVAAKIGLPEVFIDRLKGETPEELTADAQALMDGLPHPEEKKPAISTLINPTNPAGASASETPAQKRARLLGSPDSVFNADFSTKKGGGVTQPPNKE
jgi:hypothetical protein